MSSNFDINDYLDPDYDLDHLKVAAIKQIFTTNGIPFNKKGRKAELLKRLKEVLEDMRSTQGSFEKSSKNIEVQDWEKEFDNPIIEMTKRVTRSSKRNLSSGILSKSETKNLPKTKTDAAKVVVKGAKVVKPKISSGKTLQGLAALSGEGKGENARAFKSSRALITFNGSPSVPTTNKIELASSVSTKLVDTLENQKLKSILISSIPKKRTADEISDGDDFRSVYEDHSKVSKKTVNQKNHFSSSSDVSKSDGKKDLNVFQRGNPIEFAESDDKEEMEEEDEEDEEDDKDDEQETVLNHTLNDTPVIYGDSNPSNGVDVVIDSIDSFEQSSESSSSESSQEEFSLYVKPKSAPESPPYIAHVSPLKINKNAMKAFLHPPKPQALAKFQKNSEPQQTPFDFNRFNDGSDNTDNEDKSNDSAVSDDLNDVDNLDASEHSDLDDSNNLDNDQVQTSKIQFVDEHKIEAQRVTQESRILMKSFKESAYFNNTTKKCLLTFIGSILTFESINFYRSRKILVGFCGKEVYTPFFKIFRNSFSKFDAIVGKIENLLTPECVPCPDNGQCFELSELVCDNDFTLYVPWYKGFGFIPSFNQCVLDKKKLKNVKTIVDMVSELLAKRNAEYDCGQGSDEKVGMIVKSIKKFVSNNLPLGREIQLEDFEYLWNKSESLLKIQNDLVFVSSDHTSKDLDSYLTQNDIIRSHSVAKMTFKCKLKVLFKQLFIRYKWKISRIIIVLFLVYYVHYRIRKLMNKFKLVREISKKVLSKLQSQSNDFKNKKTSVRFLGKIHLRDHFLDNSISIDRKNEIWNDVSKFVEHNTNISSRNEEFQGEVLKVWEWISDI